MSNTVKCFRKIEENATPRASNEELASKALKNVIV